MRGTGTTRRVIGAPTSPNLGPGSVVSQLKISNGHGGFTGVLDGTYLDDYGDPNFGDLFGHASAAADIDGDGIRDLVVSATDDGREASLWVLFLRTDGSVRAQHEIDGTPFGDMSLFGWALTAPGDIDGDGVPDLVVSQPLAQNGGAIWVLLLNPNGTVKGPQRTPAPGGSNFFGSSLAALGDLDDDGIVDIAVGERSQNAIWIFFLAANGTVRAQRKITQGLGGFTGVLHPGDFFGEAMTSIGDLDGDGVGDLAVSAIYDDDGQADSGAVWVVFLRNDGSVKSHKKISLTQGGFAGPLALQGNALCAPGDLDGDGIGELVVSATAAHWLGGADRLSVLFLRADGTVRSQRRISATEGGFAGTLAPLDEFGSSLTALGDQDGDGIADLAVGARMNDDGGAEDSGAVWVLFLDGVASLDFQRGDDQERSALQNGQALSSPPAFGRSLQLSSTGANIGLAIFDSKPLGPNDPGPDLDLLVGRGNVLVLQNSQFPAQTTPGVFDRPNDDQDGGTMTIAFPAPSEVLGLDLIDIDQGASASVKLFDDGGWKRTYSIPPGWTEDLVAQGPPGYRRLDLTTLAPQAGYASVASSTQISGFDPRRVIRIEVLLRGSGALDNLSWDPHPAH